MLNYDGKINFRLYCCFVGACESSAEGAYRDLPAGAILAEGITLYISEVYNNGCYYIDFLSILGGNDV